MINNFIKVNDKVYRGSAPSCEDVEALHHFYDVNNIVSLDIKDGNDISEICNKLGIKHFNIELKYDDIKSVANLLKYNIYELLNPNKITYVHCHRGKDRTGFLIALMRCIMEGWDCKTAIKEAKHLGYGTGLELPVEKLYTKIISRSCSDEHIDSNHAFDNYDGINLYYQKPEEISYFDKSFAPFAPINYAPYPYAQSVPRAGTSVTAPEPELLNNDIEHLPLVGVYDSKTQITNSLGPSLFNNSI